MIDWERIKKQQEEALFIVNKKIVTRSIAASSDRLFVEIKPLFKKINTELNNGGTILEIDK